MAIERIVIENFKGIKKLDLEVRPFTVLIGPQSVGKSTTAKLLYFFKEIAHETVEAATNLEVSLESHLVERFQRFMPHPTRKGGKSSIHYYVGRTAFSLTSAGSDDSNWRIELPKMLREEFDALKSELAASPKQASASRLKTLIEFKRRFGDGLKTNLAPQFAFEPQFIPAGRSFYTHIEKDPISFFESATLDPFIALFGKQFARVKNDFLLARFGAPEFVHRAAELSELLLSGKYCMEGERDLILTADGQKIHGALWSSGQQECFPLVLFLYNLCLGSMGDLSLFVEEPEAHLFPASQRYMVELLALAFRAKAGRLNLFVTTHSPYILSTLNLLLRLGQAGGLKPLRGSNGAVVNPLLEALHSDSLGAYYMDQKGCHSIIDNETKLIDGSGIDDVSGEIAEQFDAIDALQ
jgi:hypothetical protein